MNLAVATVLAFVAGVVAWAIARAPLGRWVAWLFTRVEY